jgi:chemotaxis protein MotB
MVEGHTDDVPYTKKGNILDNWDLSVKRATAVVRILQNDYGVDPKRMTAAGRAEYVPVSSTEKSRNRRTRIVVLPKIDQFYSMIEEGMKDPAISN